MVKDAFATCKADCTWQSGYLAPQVFLGCITELPVVVQLAYLRYELCRVSCLVGHRVVEVVVNVVKSTGCGWNSCIGVFVSLQ